MSHHHHNDSADAIERLPDPNEVLPALKVYSHTKLFYWWPVWVTGFIMAILTAVSGERLQSASMDEYIHPSDSLGVIYILVFFLVLIFTNFTFRGGASLGVVLAVGFFAMLFALLGIWDSIFEAISLMSIHMNLGFYLLTSSLLFALWAYSTFVHIRWQYYYVRPGQIEAYRLIGDSETNYDTRGAVVEKFGEDVFRHWILGLGSGDIRITTAGARSDSLIIKNVLWVDRTISNLRRLTAVQPDSLMDEMGREEHEHDHQHQKAHSSK